MNTVKAKKHLGQHFLKDEQIAINIANSISYNRYKTILEIGPGMGVLTKYLLEKNIETHVVEIDKESVIYLEKHYPKLNGNIISEDFLKFNFVNYFNHQQFAIIGNFPYNISTQIVFKVLEMRDYIPEFSGMFQKEVAERICHKEGSKAYGILSVLTQAFYEVEYLFTVSEAVFNPPPKVKSGVMKMTRKEDYSIPCSISLFYQVVKLGFNQRRKTLRNSLKSFTVSQELNENELLDKRPEQLSVQEFIELTLKIEQDGKKSF
jgi:16S rRNA (adenine1518-N6/adenine1519-N6)-dimethyltransferase